MNSPNSFALTARFVGSNLVYEEFAQTTEQDMTETLPSSDGRPLRSRIKTVESPGDFIFDNDERCPDANLNVDRDKVELPSPRMPHPGSDISWGRDGRRGIATSPLKEDKLRGNDTDGGTTLKTTVLRNPALFLRSSGDFPNFSAGMFCGPKDDVIPVEDKQNPEVVNTLRNEPGTTAVHVEFTRNGRYDLLFGRERRRRDRRMRRHIFEQHPQQTEPQTIRETQCLKLNHLH